MVIRRRTRHRREYSSSSSSSRRGGNHNLPFLIGAAVVIFGALAWVDPQPKITNKPGPGTDVNPPQHCDTITISGALPPPLTGAQYAIRGVQGKVCCPTNQVFFYQPAKSNACCPTPLTSSGGVTYCPAAVGTGKFNAPFNFPAGGLNQNATALPPATNQSPFLPTTGKV